MLRLVEDRARDWVSSVAYRGSSPTAFVEEWVGCEVCVRVIIHVGFMIKVMYTYEICVLYTLYSAGWIESLWLVIESTYEVRMYVNVYLHICICCS